MPKDIIARLNAVLAKVVSTPETKEAFARQGLEPQTITPGEFGAFISGQLAQNAKLIQAIGIKAE